MSFIGNSSSTVLVAECCLAALDCVQRRHCRLATVAKLRSAAGSNKRRSTTYEGQTDRRFLCAEKAPTDERRRERDTADPTPRTQKKKEATAGPSGREPTDIASELLLACIARTIPCCSTRSFRQAKWAAVARCILQSIIRTSCRASSKARPREATKPSRAEQSKANGEPSHAESERPKRTRLRAAAAGRRR